MKKAPVKKTDLIESLKAATQGESCARWALSLSLESSPEAVRHVKISNVESYEFRLYGSRFSFGGLILRIFRYKGQSDQVSANFLDETTSEVNLRSWPLEARIALDQLRTKARQLQQEQGWYSGDTRELRSIRRLKATA